MNATKRTVAIGIFDDKRRAREAVEMLREKGFDDDRIGVAARDSDVKEEVEAGLPDRSDTYAEEGATGGAVGGAAVGGLWGLGIVAGLLPAVGPVVAGGALAATLASAGLGAAAGSLAGTLIGWGIPEDEANAHERDLQEGRILIAVRADRRVDEALSVLKDCHARA